LLKKQTNPKAGNIQLLVVSSVFKLFFQFGDYFLMLLKTKLFGYLLLLIVSAKHIEKIWLHLSVVWEHFKILKYFSGREIPFYPARP